MAAVTYNISVEAGASFSVDFTRKDATGVTEVPFEEGATAFFQVRTTASAAGVPLLETSPVINSATVTLALTPAETRALDIAGTASFKYAIEIHYTGGAVDRLVQGDIAVSPELVRDEGA